MSHELKPLIEKYTGMKQSNIIMAFASGSHLHGARGDSGDLDISGVVIERPEKELTIGNENPKSMGHYEGGTSDDKHKNTQEDVDVQLYTLRRWGQLALKGNPTATSFLFVPLDNPGYYHTYVWDYIVAHRNHFLSKKVGRAFLGFCYNQYHRMEGEESTFGEKEFKPKFAMHMIRGLLEVLELLTTGVITYPNPKKDILLDIRNERMKKEDILDLYKQLNSEVEQALITSPLPEEGNAAGANTVITRAILNHWKEYSWI